jgi:DNA-directed RNA polymerase subunit P
LLSWQQFREFVFEPFPQLSIPSYYLTLEMFKSKMFFFVGQALSMEKSGIVYECMRCGSRVPSEELELRGGETKCIICGYRILKKVKPPVVKRVKSK